MSSFGFRPKKTVPARTKFFKSIEKNGEHWRWVGTVDSRGIGRVSEMRDGKVKWFYAARLSWLIHRGPVPDGMVVLNNCGSKGCVNPDHLRADRPKRRA